MPEMSVDQRMSALLDAELDHRERRNMQSEAHPPTPARDRSLPWTAEQILGKLERSNVFVERALTLLYSYQTSDEQASQSTNEDNGVGFNMVDAAFLSSLAQQVQENARNPRSRFHREGTRLSDNQRRAARRKLTKYVNQLVRHANRNHDAQRAARITLS